MLTGEQLEGLNDLLDGIRGAAESGSDSRRERMKRFAAEALETGLTGSQRKLMLLLYVEGLTQQEAGERLGRSQSAVSRMHGRAIARLRKLAQFVF